MTLTQDRFDEIRTEIRHVLVRQKISIALEMTKLATLVTILVLMIWRLH